MERGEERRASIHMQGGEEEEGGRLFGWEGRARRGSVSSMDMERRGREGGAREDRGWQGMAGERRGGEGRKRRGN